MEDLAGRSMNIAIVASKHVGRFVIESAAAANACKHVEFYTTMNKHLRSILRKRFYAFQIVAVSLALSSHEER